MSKSPPSRLSSSLIPYDDFDPEWNYYDEPQPRNPTYSQSNISPTSLSSSTLSTKRKKNRLSLMDRLLGTSKRPEISTPYDTVHLTHVGFNSSTGEYVGLPKEWQQMLSDSGITYAEQERNPQAVIEVMKFYQETHPDIYDAELESPSSQTDSPRSPEHRPEAYSQSSSYFRDLRSPPLHVYGRPSYNSRGQFSPPPPIPVPVPVPAPTPAPTRSWELPPILSAPGPSLNMFDAYGIPQTTSSPARPAESHDRSNSEQISSSSSSQLWAVRSKSQRNAAPQTKAIAHHQRDRVDKTTDRTVPGGPTGKSGRRNNVAPPPSIKPVTTNQQSHAPNAIITSLMVRSLDCFSTQP
ncbi:signal transducing kinase of the PAK [Ceratobasidium sp. 395]|nr:signal transducing kinase of the PAK [Ceratobasidium sp. 395]